MCIRDRLKAVDPEGFKVAYYKHILTPGRIEGDQYIWDCPSNQQAKDIKLDLIASDGTCGNSYAGVSIPINVRSVLVNVAADKKEGNIPLAVNFSTAGSQDVKGGRLRFDWDFGDGKRSSGASPKHVFKTAGFHQVKVKVSGASGTSTQKLLVHAKPKWKHIIDDGWSKSSVDKSVWSIGSDVTANASHYRQIPSMQIIVSKRSHQRKAVTSQAKISAPCFVDVQFVRGNKVPGVGIEILGATFGRGATDFSVLNSPKGFAPDLSFTHEGDSGEIDQILIGDFPKQPTGTSRLMLYVIPDAYNSGRFVFTGFLEGDSGRSFFRIDNRKLSGDRIAILAGELGMQHITKFGVWAR